MADKNGTLSGISKFVCKSEQILKPDGVDGNVAPIPTTQHNTAAVKSIAYDDRGSKAPMTEAQFEAELQREAANVADAAAAESKSTRAQQEARDAEIAKRMEEEDKEQQKKRDLQEKADAELAKRMEAATNDAAPNAVGVIHTKPKSPSGCPSRSPSRSPSRHSPSRQSPSRRSPSRRRSCRRRSPSRRRSCRRRSASRRSPRRSRRAPSSHPNATSTPPLARSSSSGH